MALFTNTTAQLPQLLFTRGEDLRSDAARAIGQVKAIQSAGSDGAMYELLGFFQGCIALTLGVAVGKAAAVYDTQTFPLAGGGTATIHVTNGQVSITVA